MEKAILKFNGGNLALLCSNCSVIIKTGAEFNEEEKDFAFGLKDIPPMYCDDCKNNVSQKEQNV